MTGAPFLPAGDSITVPLGTRMRSFCPIRMRETSAKLFQRAISSVRTSYLRAILSTLSPLATTYVIVCLAFEVFGFFFGAAKASDCPKLIVKQTTNAINHNTTILLILRRLTFQTPLGNSHQRRDIAHISLRQPPPLRRQSGRVFITFDRIYIIFRSPKTSNATHPDRPGHGAKKDGFCSISAHQRLNRRGFD